MRKTITLFLGAILLAAGMPGLALACTPSLGHPPLARQGYLIAAINPTVPPLQYIDDAGNIVGLDANLGAAIAKRLCLTLQLESTMFATMIPMLKEGRIDMVDSFMYYTPERAAQVLMVPYGASSLAIVVRKDNADKIDGLDYFSGKRFGVELGTVDSVDAHKASVELQKSGKPPIGVHTFSTYAAVLQALTAQQVDGGFIPTEQAFWYKYHAKGREIFRIALTGFDPHAEALAFKEPALARAVVQVLNELHADGTLQKMFAPVGACVLPGPYQVTSGVIAQPECRPAPQ